MYNIETYSYLVFGPMVAGHSTYQDLRSMFPFAKSMFVSMAFIREFGFSLFHLLPFLLLRKRMDIM